MSPPPSLEAKIVVLGSQSVGKTSLVHRYVQNAWMDPRKVQSTVGASFLTTKVQDPESGTTIRLQIWDTAGQERFRSISRLYYRGAHAAILCYDITSRKSFEQMGIWLKELKENCGLESEQDMILHVVGTKADVVAQDPKMREVPFEWCIGYVAEMLYPTAAGTLGHFTGDHPAGSSIPTSTLPPNTLVLGNTALPTPQSNRSSFFWGNPHEQVWDCCHEVSAMTNEGVEEIFRVVTRKLVDQHLRRQEKLRAFEEMYLQNIHATGLIGRTPGYDGAVSVANSANPHGGMNGYFDLPHPGSGLNGNGSFRLGHGDKRRSWLGALAATTPGTVSAEDEDGRRAVVRGMKNGRCC